MNKVNASSGEAAFTDRFRRLTELLETCKENANCRGERFNLFSILGVQRNETRSHSRYLAELLNPTGRHGEGSRFLDAFVKDTLGVSTPMNGRIKVTRELATEDQRRVDIVIDSSDLIVGIEVKIDAGDQDAQLHDYYRELHFRAKDQKQSVLVYLTLDGKTPSVSSLRGLEKDNVHCLSFAHDIHQWIERCTNLSNHKPELSHALVQYKRLIENLTGAGTSMISLIADNLSNNADDLQTALDVEKALPEAKATIMLRFWEELSAALTDALGETPVVYGDRSLRAMSKNYFNGSRGGKHVGIKHPIGVIDGENLCLYVNIYHAIHYGLRVDNPSGTPVSRPETKAKLQEKFSDGNAVANKEANWLVCYYHDPSPGQEPVVLNFHSFNESVLGLLDESNQQAIIKSMVDHQVRLVTKAKALIETSPA